MSKILISKCKLFHEYEGESKLDDQLFKILSILAVNDEFLLIDKDDGREDDVS